MTRYGWSDRHTTDCTETHARNQPTEKVQLPPRKHPNQQAMLGHTHELISRSHSDLVTKHDLRSGSETSQQTLCKKFRKPRLPHFSECTAFFLPESALSTNRREYLSLSVLLSIQSDWVRPGNKTCKLGVLLFTCEGVWILACLTAWSSVHLHSRLVFLRVSFKQWPHKACSNFKF